MKAVAQVQLVHAYEHGLQDDGRQQMDEEVVANLFETIMPQNVRNVDDEAEEVDEDHLVPFLETREACKYHHDEPAGERFVEIKTLRRLRYALFGAQQAHNRNHANVEIVFHLGRLLAYVVNTADDDKNS